MATEGLRRGFQGSMHDGLLQMVCKLCRAVLFSLTSSRLKEFFIFLIFLGILKGFSFVDLLGVFVSPQGFLYGGIISLTIDSPESNSPHLTGA